MKEQATQWTLEPHYCSVCFKQTEVYQGDHVLRCKTCGTIVKFTKN